MLTATATLIKFDKKGLEDNTLLQLYMNMLKPRLIEEKMLKLLRQGKVSKWFSGIGQEAISVGVTMALQPNEYILPMHRNLGVFTTRKVPLEKLFSQWQGKANGFTKGRDRSFHFGTQEHKIVGMISHLGPQLGVADGIALANIISNTHRVTAVFTGEGGTSEGDFHEALNIASVWNLPVLFCIENNGYGLSTPTKEQYACRDLADRGKGYGIDSFILDGNNIIEIYTKVIKLTESMRKRPRPILVEFKTFRMRGHEEASGTKYVPEEVMNEWKSKDPIENFKSFLIVNKILTVDIEEQFQSEISKEIDDALEAVNEEPIITADTNVELGDVYQPFEITKTKVEATKDEIRFIDAISDGLREGMRKHKELVLMGQDIAEYGGVFKITEGFLEEFGKDRVRNTPICESGIVETAMGLSIAGMKSVVEMQFADFVSSGFNPIVNYLAKSYYRWNQNADVVIRMPCGAGVGAGPFHSQTNEAWFTKTPGLKVVYPAFPEDAKGLLLTAIADPNPVMFFEHKGLYRSKKGDVPKGYYNIPFGKANILRNGKQVTIISYGAAVHWALEVLDNNPEIDATVLDLRSLQPLDTETIFTSVKETNKAIILHEDSLFGGIGADISALIMENCFNYLDAPVIRVGSIETPIPFAENLENNYLPKVRFEKELKNLLNY
ncbi:alpha-ketoacid dehydrogenase subunit alpha/beta [Aegicerativicinus sediminis]|uniref:alpha-ketoacid dehydrogenase subunit alpha/beta n=1 Tax=Aegicerativicinus sediminis TaxID=2893202 RepID=UPI001E296022|nr:dehydrogenase E1 component subunit alpha/beta [Aegicerativicinus sediminis]